MFKNNSKGKCSNKSKLKQKQKVKSQQGDPSAYVTRNRLTRHPGIFERGKSTGTVLRDPLVTEDTIARAEQNLSLIFQLNNRENVVRSENTKKKNGTKKVTVPSQKRCVDNTLKKCDEASKQVNKYKGTGTSKASNQVNSKKHLTQTEEDGSDVSTPLSTEREVSETCSTATTTPLSRDETENVQINSSIARVTRELQNDTGKAGKSDDSGNHSKSYAVPYRNFEKCIKLSLMSASKKLNNHDELQTEISDLLYDSYNYCFLQFTPPSKIKKMSNYFHESESPSSVSTKAKEDIFEPKHRRSTSSSSSAVTPHFDETVCPPTLVINPRGLIERYERRLELTPNNNMEKCDIKSKESDSPQQISTPSSGIFPRSLSNMVCRTPLKSAGIDQPIPKTVVVNPLNYIERYEKRVDRQNEINSNDCEGNPSVSRVIETNEMKKDKVSIWNAKCQNDQVMPHPSAAANCFQNDVNSLPHSSSVQQASVDHNRLPLSTHFLHGNEIWGSADLYHRPQFSHSPLAKSIYQISPYIYSPANEPSPPVFFNHTNVDYSHAMKENIATSIHTHSPYFQHPPGLDRNHTNTNFMNSFREPGCYGDNGLCANLQTNAHTTSKSTATNENFSRFAPHHFDASSSINEEYKRNDFHGIIDFNR